jgi:hypothetical protein
VAIAESAPIARPMIVLAISSTVALGVSADNSDPSA